MLKVSLLLTAAAGLALAGGAAHAQQSWGPKHTTYWSSDATGRHEPGKFMATAIPVMTTQTTTVQMQAPAQRRMYYQPAAKRVRATMRMRQQQPNMRPGQPPADVAPSAPPSRGQQPMQHRQPGQVPK